MFQSTLLREERLGKMLGYVGNSLFQSTLLREERLYDVYVIDITDFILYFMRMTSR